MFSGNFDLIEEIFFYFFVPGFIIYKMTILFLPLESKDLSNYFAEIVAYGALNYAFVAFLILIFDLDFSLVIKEQGTGWLDIKDWRPIFFLFVTPLIISLLLIYLFKHKGFRKRVYDVYPYPWDSYFSREQNKYVIVSFNDGTFVGGYFGRNSYASKFPKKKAIYLEEEWLIDDENEKFIAKIPDSNGIWVNCIEVKSIKFYRKYE